MKLPVSFKPILWSYDFDRIDPERHKEVIITSAINYGDLEHWKWIKRHYGRSEVVKVINSAPEGLVRKRARRLFSIMFEERDSDDVSRSVN